MSLRLACLTVVVATFAATAQAATPPGKIFKLPLPAANHAKLYLISATLKPGMPAADASMGVLDANPNALPGGVRAAARTRAITSGGTTTYYVLVGINNLGGRSVLAHRGGSGEIDIDLIYSASVFGDPKLADVGCAKWLRLFEANLAYTDIRLGGWSSSPREILEKVTKKFGC